MKKLFLLLVLIGSAYAGDTNTVWSDDGYIHKITILDTISGDSYRYESTTYDAYGLKVFEMVCTTSYASGIADYISHFYHNGQYYATILSTYPTNTLHFITHDPTNTRQWITHKIVCPNGTVHNPSKTVHQFNASQYKAEIFMDKYCIK